MNAVPTTVAAAELVAAIEGIPDPEVPVVSIKDLGILRDVTVDEGGRKVAVTITPTYSGCPAMDAIRDRIAHVSGKNGYAPTVSTQLSPAWTTDWMSEEGRTKLEAFGIAPPGQRADMPVPVPLVRRVVACPRCGSTDTTELAHFGSTACKALRRCESCWEPFDEFKAI